jgi:hypothetical protein
LPQDGIPDWAVNSESLELEVASVSAALGMEKERER